MVFMKKILIIGGKCQGKTKWTQENFPEYKNESAEELLKENRQGRVKGKVWINGFHLYMKQWLRAKEDYKEKTKLLVENPSWIIVSDEIGSGIVPMDKEEREWREETGRMLCKIAEQADEVYRVFCGIPTMIKGSDV